MRPIRTTRQLERNLKRARRRGKDIDKLSLSVRHIVGYIRS